jgi:hypothetical protein
VRQVVDLRLRRLSIDSMAGMSGMRLVGGCNV